MLRSLWERTEHLDWHDGCKSFAHKKVCMGALASHWYGQAVRALVVANGTQSTMGMVLSQEGKIQFLVTVGYWLLGKEVGYGSLVGKADVSYVNHLAQVHGSSDRTFASSQRDSATWVSGSKRERSSNPPPGRTGKENAPTTETRRCRGCKNRLSSVVLVVSLLSPTTAYITRMVAISTLRGIAFFCETAKPDNCRAGSLKVTVRDSTWEGYASEARGLIAVCSLLQSSTIVSWKMSPPPPTAHVRFMTADAAMYYIAHNIPRNLFSTYIYARSMRAITNNRHVRCAVAKAQEVYGGNTWARDQLVIAETDGAETRATMMSKKQPSVGSITKSMYKQLVKTLDHRQKKSMSVAMMVQFGAALRYSELIGLHVSDILNDGIYIRNPKQIKARYIFLPAQRVKQVSLWKWGRKALKALRKLGRGKHKEEKLFPPSKWKAKEYNDQIKRAAVIHKWSPDVRIRGSHSLRHGGVREAHRDLEGRLAPKDIDEVLKMSSNMVSHYKASNEERIAKDAASEKTRLTWLKSHNI